MSSAGGVVVSGVGRAAPGDALASTGAAVRAALSDAGTSVSDVDGLLACGVDAYAVSDLFGFELCWRTEISDHGALGAAAVQAVDAVVSGRLRAIVCVETIPPPDPQIGADRFGRAEAATGWASWHAPYGADDETVDVALDARAYIERFGLTRPDLARIAIVASANAGRVLSLRDYLSAPMLADPLCVHDRARPAGGSAAVVLEPVGRVERRSGSRPVGVGGVGAAYAVSPLAERDSERAADRAGASLREDLHGAVPGILLIGDEYSFRVVTWLEALGLCDPGCAGSILATAGTLSRGGRFPVNPHGGHLGLGRRPDLDLVVEAVARMRGSEGGSESGGPPSTSVVALGGAGSAGCLFLRRTS